MTSNDTRDPYETYIPTDFSKIKVGLQTLKDATLEDVSPLKRIDPRYADKHNVQRAIAQNDLDSMREISNFFYRESGIYNRLCRYLAYMYRYDWMATPYINDEKLKDSKVLDSFYKVLNYLDNFGVKDFFGDVALKVVRNGCYYGYIIDAGDRVNIQELPVKYCRSRFRVNDRPAVEFNMDGG